VRAQHGFEDLELWLLDTLRRGVATAVSEDPDFYKNIAARLADASMRSLSRSIRTLEAVPADRPDWPERMTAVLADAALALNAFRRREYLPEALLHDLEAFIGISVKKETVRAEGETLHDAWAVVGAVEEQVEEQLRQRRTWLLGARSGRYALLLEYAYGDPEFLPGLAPGSVVEGALIFYPSAWPHRALVSDELNRLPKNVEKLPGFEKIEDAVHTYADALGKQPWLSAFPVALNEVVPGGTKTVLVSPMQTANTSPLAMPIWFAGRWLRSAAGVRSPFSASGTAWRFACLAPCQVSGLWEFRFVCCALPTAKPNPGIPQTARHLSPTAPPPAP
jgi:hypothetical protein